MVMPEHIFTLQELLQCRYTALTVNNRLLANWLPCYYMQTPGFWLHRVYLLFERRKLASVDVSMNLQLCQYPLPLRLPQHSLRP